MILFVRDFFALGSCACSSNNNPSIMHFCLNNSCSNFLQINLNDGLQEVLVSLNSHSAHLTTVRILLLKTKMNLSDALDQVMVSFELLHMHVLPRQKFFH